MSYELPFRDSITHILTSACKPGRCVEQHVAEALCRFFLTTPLYVVWRSSALQPDAVGAACDELGAPARLMRHDELVQLASLVPPMSADREYEHLTIQIFDAPESKVWAVDLFNSEHEGCDLFRLIVVHDPSVGPHRFARIEERASFFKRYLDGQRQLYAVLKALHAAARLAEWGFGVERLISNWQAPLSERIELAARMIEQMSRHPTLEMMALVKRLSIWTVQQMLGTGWRVRRMDGKEDRAHVTALCKHIRVAAQQWEECSEGACAATGTDPFVGPLHCLADIIEAEPGSRALLQEPEPAAHRGADLPLKLLRTWTLMHEVARAIHKHPLKAGPQAESDWKAVTLTREKLACVIKESFAAADGDAARFRNCLRLWFCHQIDWSTSRPITRTDLWEWRAELSYVLRESLRFECFGDRSDYRAEPASLSAALRKLIEYHSDWNIKLAAHYDVRKILREIGEVPQAEEYHFATGHLQHVLGAYIAGHFFCKIKIRDPEDGTKDPFAGWTLAKLLVAKGAADPGEDMEDNFLRVFSVAALFHDVGMMLFPRHMNPRPNLYGGNDTQLANLLGGVVVTLEKKGADVAKECVNDLSASGYVDKVSEPLLGKWIEDQKSRGPGKPDHALLGAWYLHQICEAAPGHTPDVQRDALRTILLHQTMGTIDATKDPAAALLVLCDELFEWDPYTRAVPVPNAVSLSLHTMAVDLEPHPSRARKIRMHGLQVEATPEGDVIATLSREAGNGNWGWPRFEVELKHAEFLDAQVHRYWLTVAQNLGRIQRSTPGFGPTVRLVSHVPAWLAKVGGSRLLLGQALNTLAAPLRKSLETWLSDDSRFEFLDKLEVVNIGPVDSPFPNDDVRDSLALIEIEVDKILRP